MCDGVKRTVKWFGSVKEYESLGHKDGPEVFCDCRRDPLDEFESQRERATRSSLSRVWKGLQVDVTNVLRQIGKPKTDPSNDGRVSGVTR